MDRVSIEDGKKSHAKIILARLVEIHLLIKFKHVFYNANNFKIAQNC